ncbi:uncharacterized protein LOC110254426 [Exaiptasia diaphana]|uniref:ShKT domain-containing protein n=1 Tax=Exaiptasia diaphana TaxID=2652724 RepID=A0A913YYV5_EXADI|nr:uncharacterized protein LOC110254426 [Exaiptasia diaphana]
MILVLLLALVVVSNGLPDCTDKQKDSYGCNIWFNQGLCSDRRYTAFMENNCPVACGLCKAPPPTEPPPPQNVDVDITACLEAHNAKRRLHGVPDLTWDDGLAGDGKAWALILAKKDGRLKHSSGTYGENLYYSSSQNIKTCEQAVERWYNEIKDYDYDNPGYGSKTGHFTQVVWKSSTKLGVGKATADAGGGYKKTYIVAQYTPSGNVPGQFPDNVLPLLSSHDEMLGEHEKRQSKVKSLECGLSSSSRTQSKSVAKICTSERTTAQSDMFLVLLALVVVANGLPATPPPPPDNVDVDITACLDAHNAKRRLHGTPTVTVPDLTWDDGLADEAEKWALKLAKSGKFKGSSGDYGENLYLSMGSNSGTCEEAVQSWYDEIKDYDYKFSKETKHFTQVVWKSSTKVGVGKATAEADGYTKTYIVARYTPAGNERNKFAENVLPLKNKSCQDVLKREFAMMRKTVIVLLVFAVVLALQVHEAESRDCRDQGQYANHCPYWKRLGYCASGGKYHSWMMKNCKKTCSGCGDCRDQGKYANHCPYWKRLGYCASGGNSWMMKNCKKTCSGCAATNANTNQKNHGNSGNNGNHQNACLRIHNTLRRKHGVPDLSWDYELASKALQYARKLAYTNTFKHDKERGRGIGENLFASSNPKSTVEEATQAWYDEIKYYNFNNPGFSMKTGHFTQVVWKGTTRLGCGIATTSRRAVVVARYAPAGNVNSKAYFRANVPRPR